MPIGLGITATARTASYRMVLDVGPVEPMYSAAQVAAEHPSMGEVMLRGQMADVPGMSMPASGSSLAASTTAGAPMTMGSSTTTMGSSSSPMSTTGSSASRHLEVHICSTTTGRVITDAEPTITVTDSSEGNMSTRVPIAVMEGIGQGTSDLHYGNNVVMAGGHDYTVLVQLGSQTAVFHLRIPNG